jgi:hypothetical protein
MRRIPIIAALLLALLPAAAYAADEKDVVVVSVEGARLLVHDDTGNRLCTRVDGGEDGNAASSGCGPAPTGRFDGDIRTVTIGNRTFTAGVVPADGTTVELEYGDESRTRTPALAGDAYQGRFKGKLRFFLIEQPKAKGEPVLVRRFDDAGKLLGASSGGGFDIPSGEPVTLLRGKGTRVTVALRRSFSPTPLEIDRVGRTVCVTVKRGGDSTSCSEERPFAPVLSVESTTECGPTGTLVAGLTRSDIPRVALLLGSGRRIVTRTHELIGTVGTTRRGVAVTAPRGEAVRAAIALGENGKEADRQIIGAPPITGVCSKNGSTTSYGSEIGFGDPGPFVAGPPDGQQVAAGAAPGAQLVARDEGEFICIGIDRLAADKRDCGLPQVQDLYPFAVHRATAARTAAGGVVTLDTASVRIEIDGARMVDATMSDGGDYSGRYRGAVRFFLAETAGRHRITAVELRDADGKIVSLLPGPDEPDLDAATIARGRGFRLFGMRYAFTFKYGGEPLRHQRGSCIGLVLGSETPAFDRCALSSDGFGSVLFGEIACSPRLGVLFGRMGKNMRGVALTLATGKRLLSGTVKVPARYGGGRLWVLRIPPGARATRLTFLGTPPKPRFGPRPARTGRYALPAPRQQCGYGARDPEF